MTTGNCANRLPIFKGSTPEMSGNIFECYGKEEVDDRTGKPSKHQDEAPLFADKMKEPAKIGKSATGCGQDVNT
jgi:hypothetical protein